MIICTCTKNKNDNFCIHVFNIFGGVGMAITYKGRFGAIQIYNQLVYTGSIETLAYITMHV